MCRFAICSSPEWESPILSSYLTSLFFLKKDDQSFPHWSKRAQGVPWIWMQAFLVEDGNWKHACVSSTCVLNTMMMLIMMAIAPCLQACVLHAHHYCVVREQGHFSTPGDWPYWLLKGAKNIRKGTVINTFPMCEMKQAYMVHESSIEVLEFLTCQWKQVRFMYMFSSVYSICYHYVSRIITNLRSVTG